MRIRITVEYDGTDFCGWQTQPNGITVQEELEKAVEKLTGVRSAVVGSGRTDSGVHARGQVAHFDTEAEIPPENFAFALSAILPKGIAVVKSERAEEGFHARFSAKRKTYVYRIYCSKTDRPLLDRYAARLDFPVDEVKMNEAAKYFVGERDFKCFLASNSAVKDTVRTVYGAEVIKNGDLIEFTVTGNGFLYNMVRIMAGTLVDVGRGKLTAADVGRIIEGGERSSAGATMPARGLTLEAVDYGEKHD